MLRFVGLGILSAAIALAAAAQDTHYPPRGQQIPAPDCTLRNAWESAQTLACPYNIHERWLRDIEHWRAERRIRTAFAPARYEIQLVGAGAKP